MADELDPTIKDIEAYLNSSLERVKEPISGCRHLQVLLDSQAHTVTCKACGKQIDAFWYLCLLSQEWDMRRYRDEAAKEAYRKLQESDRMARARGKTFTRPMKACPAQEAWDIFTAYHDKEPYAVWYRGGEWYAGSDSTESCEGISYLRELLAQRAKQERNGKR